jgi:hypothetical protein
LLVLVREQLMTFSKGQPGCVQRIVIISCCSSIICANLQQLLGDSKSLGLVTIQLSFHRYHCFRTHYSDTLEYSCASLEWSGQPLRWLATIGWSGARSDNAPCHPRGCRPAEPYEHNLDPTCTPTSTNACISTLRELSTSTFRSDIFSDPV